MTLRNNNNSNQLQILAQQQHLPLGSMPPCATSHSKGSPPIRSTATYDPAKGFDSVEELVMNDTLIELHRKYYNLNEKQPFVFFVTPTYKRLTQMVDMVRLAQTLSHDKGIYWLVVEDAERPTNRIRDLLERTGLPFAHIAVLAPPKDKQSGIARGVEQRNGALRVIESLRTPGVIYFGDDDNAYDTRIFPQLRQTKRVGVSGVGYAVDTYERCHVDKETGKVDHIFSNWQKQRKFKMDMAGFAFHTSILREKKPRFRNDWGKGMLESKFLEQMISGGVADLEPLDNCEAIYAWHVKTMTPSVKEHLKVKGDEDFDRLLPTI